MNRVAVLARVGETAITEADFQLFCAVSNIPTENQAKVRAKLVKQLVERELIRQALRRHQVEANPEELATSIALVEELIRRRKDDPEALLKRLGLTRTALEEQLGLSIAWAAYVEQTLTEDQVAAFFTKHHAEFDGTQVRASQIILKVKPESPPKEISDRKTKLAALREGILAKKVSFADAAKKHSEAPSKEYGGDVGWFPFRGKMPAAICDAAFVMKKGDLSEPIVSPFGVHLIVVTDVQPGELTLEDVRTDIVARIAQDLWKQTAEEERRIAKVVILVPEK